MFAGQNSPFSVSIYKLKKLRSLLVEFTHHDSKSDGPLFDLFGKLTCYRSLDLSIFIRSRNSINKLPKEVEQLIHLRLIDLFYSLTLIELLESLCHFYNLQILNICWHYYLKELFHGMGTLIKLRHLDNLGTYNLTFIPIQLGRLTSLCTFEHLMVGSNNNDSETMTLGDLQQLNNLRGSLQIRGLENVKDVQEATNA